MSQKKRAFTEVELRTGIDPSFLTESLTEDIELTDALFDLIDNSIDSARNSIVSSEYKKDKRGLPRSYEGYEIVLRFSSDSICIKDNCIGFHTNTIEKKAFFTGSTSNHKHGIGYYGLGLKRALLKAGNQFGILTDNGENLYKSVFNPSSLSDSAEKLIAKKYDSVGSKHTLLIVSQLHRPVIFQISNDDWFENTIRELSIRYSVFLRKGLKIKIINSQPNNSRTVDVKPSLPELRTDNLIPIIPDNFDMPDVVCDFEVGIHSEYRFPGEFGHSQKNNETLTSSYGVYYICNDRVIIEASTENKHGFTTQWHSEYGGFIFLANLVSENPRYLPWNTAKTEIKVNSPLFLEIRKKVEPMAMKYRSGAKRLINLWTKQIPKELPEEERKRIFTDVALGKGSIPIVPPKNPKPRPKPPENIKPKPNPAAQPKPPGGKPPKKRMPESLHRDREILVDWEKCQTEVPQSPERHKEYELFFELCSLSSKNTPIACAVMLRVFLETTVKQTCLALKVDGSNLAKKSIAVANALKNLGYIEHSTLELIRKYAVQGQEQAGLFTISNIQSQVHSVRFHPSQSIVNTYWTELDPFIAACWRLLKKFDDGEVLQKADE